MATHKVIGYSYDGSMFCKDCGDKNGSIELHNFPVFEGYETDSPDTCDDCGKIIEGYALTQDGIKAEAQRISNFKVSTWFERDRASVCLEMSDDSTLKDYCLKLPEWWDEGLHQAVEDGFLNPKNYLESAHEHFLEMQGWNK